MILYWKLLRNLFLGCFLLMGTCCGKNDDIRLNQIQVIGSHNSYKQPIQTELWEMIYEQDSIRAKELDYGHVSLSQQLDLGLRGLELDVFYDPKGGRYSNPLGQQLIKSQGGNPRPFDVESKMDVPGLKVFHVQDIDFRSNHLLFKEALDELKNWSLRHPGHLPIVITINAKDEVLDLPGFTHPLQFDVKALESIDQEILEVFDRSQLITPDFVRRKVMTLEQSILEYGWPSIEEVKGKFLFVLDETGAKRTAYSKGHPSLNGRVMFALFEPGIPEAAFLIVNDPIKNLDRIQELVRLGYMVRTRADEGTWEARNGDYSRWETAVKSGAQIISTDYYLPNDKFKKTYRVNFENNKIHLVNPISGGMD